MIGHHNKSPLTTNGEIHTLATIPPYSIQYNPTPKWPKYYQYVEPSLTSIICIHNQPYPTMNLQTPRELSQVLKQTINTHIDTFPINPTIPNYHIQFSNTWKNAPKNNTLTPKTIPPTTLSTRYYRQLPLKYHPQQCIYTYGSFTPPPSKNSEGQIEGNTAGSGIYSPNKNIHIS